MFVCIDFLRLFVLIYANARAQQAKCRPNNHRLQVQLPQTLTYIRMEYVRE